MIDVIADRIVRKNPFLCDWSNYGIVDIFNPVATAQYQHSVTIPTKPGMMHDFRDLRFFQPDGTEIPFWNESKTDGSTSFNWIKPYSASQRKVYVFYGNREAVSQSNGDAVFEFFDDFLGSSLDATKWTSSGSVSVAASVATLKFLTATDAILNSISTFGYEYAARFVRATLVLGSGADTYYNNLHFAVSGGTGGNFLYGNYPTKNSFGANVQELGGTWRTSDIGATYTGSHIWDILRTSASTVFKIDGGTIRTDSTYIPSGNHVVGAYAGSGVTTGITIDAILVRKYTATEPTCQLNQSGLRNPEYR